MHTLLVDTNILIDVLDESAQWHDWSLDQLDALGQEYVLAIDPMIYAELAYRFTQMEKLDRALEMLGMERLQLSYQAAYVAAQCHQKYRAKGGTRAATLPDFFIGAHAAIDELPLLTRDKGRYATYFPTVRLICP